MSEIVKNPNENEVVPPYRFTKREAALVKQAFEGWISEYVASSSAEGFEAEAEEILRKMDVDPESPEPEFFSHSPFGG